MADLAQAPGAGEGTILEAPVTGTTDGTPATETGSGTATGATSTGPAATGQAPEDSFFDPTQLTPELQGRYKQMQSAFSKKMAEMADRAKKYQALEQFSPVIEQFQRDPITTIQQLAAQQGFQLTRAQAAGVAAQQGVAPQQWEPQTWDEVLSKAEERAEARLMQKLAPIIGNVQQMTAKNIESQLDGIDPEWRTYENVMKDTLREHPTLVNDVRKLYRLSVPEDVMESRATQTALTRLTKRTDAAKASGTSTVKSAPAPPDIKTFQDAVAFAKAELSQRR